MRHHSGDQQGCEVEFFCVEGEAGKFYLKKLVLHLLNTVKIQSHPGFPWVTPTRCIIFRNSPFH